RTRYSRGIIFQIERDKIFGNFITFIVTVFLFKRRSLIMKRTIPIIIAILALIMALFHIYSGGVKLFPALQQRSVHLGLAFALIFLTYPFLKKKKEVDSEIEEELNKEQGKKEERSFKPVEMTFNIILVIASLFVGYYIMANYLTLPVELIAPSTLTLIVGVIVILLTLEATRRALGLALPIISIIAIIYAFIGDRLPLMIQHSGYSFQEIVTNIGLSGEGVFGIPLGVSATYVVLFVIFGSVLERSGAGKL